MSGRGSRRMAARLLSAAASAALASAPALAQSPQTAPPQSAPPPPGAAELDPSAPLDPMPDLGVDWPDLNANGRDDRRRRDRKARPRRRRSTDENSEIRYTIEVEGLTAIGNSEELLEGVPASSPRSKPTARIRPMPRRSAGDRSADADLLAELLRSQGYYDAVVEPRTEAQGSQLRVILTAEPGPQYRFASVELPGLEAAGEDAARLRDAFAVKAGDPVIAQDVIAGGVDLTRLLGEEGFAGAKIGEQDIEINHQTHLATLTLPVDPGPDRAFRGDPRDRPAAVQRAACRDDRPVQERRSVQALQGRRPAPRADRHDAGRERRHPGGPDRRRADRRPRGAPGTRAVAHHRRRARLRHRAGGPARGELDRPQLLQSRGRA